MTPSNIPDPRDTPATICARWFALLVGSQKTLAAAVKEDRRLIRMNKRNQKIWKILITLTALAGGAVLALFVLQIGGY